MYRSTLFIFYCILILSCQNFIANSEKNESEFVPTHEWQPVKKGQPIPKGLHVRHNFQTGLTEAKLLDKDEEIEENVNDKKIKSLALHSEATQNSKENSDDDRVNDLKENKIKLSLDKLKTRVKEVLLASEDVEKRLKDELTIEELTDLANKLTPEELEKRLKNKLSLDELKTRLKKIKFESSDISDADKQKPEETEKKFRSYDELKEEFKALELNVTTDSEILTNLFERFDAYGKSITSGSLQNFQIESIMQIFNDLEFLLHQTDNAQLFADMGGMSKIISPCLNTTNDNIRIEALRILGTAVQSNPKVQAKALDNDLVPKLLHLLTTSNKATLRSRCLFALSALLRQFPASQKVFIDHGGLEIFGKILENGQLLTQLRIIKLITDLAIERDNINKTEDDGLRIRKMREYAKTNFEQKLVLHKYCKYLANILNQYFQKNIAVDLLIELSDFYEVVLENMSLLRSTCKDEYRDIDNGLYLTLNEMLDYYDQMKAAKLLKEVEIFQPIIEQILKFQRITFGDVHDEL